MIHTYNALRLDITKPIAKYIKQCVYPLPKEMVSRGVRWKIDPQINLHAEAQAIQHFTGGRDD